MVPDAILARLMHLYGKPSILELEEALNNLSHSMDRTTTIKVMLQKMEEIQVFLLSNPKKTVALSKPSSLPTSSLK